MPIIHSTTPQAADFMNKAANTLAQYCSRWLDESKYEDIKNYAKPLKPIAAECGVEIEKMTKRPFGCIFTVKVGAETRRFTLTCSSRGVVQYKRIG